jgi:preprotein translocase subunit SecG
MHLFKQDMKSPTLSKAQNPKLIRVNRYVALVAFLWFVASLALLLFAGSSSAHAVQPRKPQPQNLNTAQQMTMLLDIPQPAARG